MSNEIITLVKDTSLARIIAVREIIMEAYSFMAKGLISPLFYAGIFYLIFNGVLQVIFGKAEKKLAYFR
jgi:polar amino acid transport system permease protein